jgi:hypothetical protein
MDLAVLAPPVLSLWSIDMVRTFLLALLFVPAICSAQQVANTYAGRDGRIGTVVIACPSQDGSYTAGPCALSKPSSVSYSGPANFAIATANTAVTVFAAGTVTTGCDFVNTATNVLYLDFTTTALAGSATSLPLAPGQSFHCPYAPTGAVSAVAAAPQSFVAIRY